MLQRIHRLVVRDIRKWTNEHVFEFGDGVTLVKGPNGAGKSTLAMALTLTMCHSANSNILRCPQTTPGRSADVKRYVYL